MRKKQWNALGYLFMVFAIIMGCFTVVYSTAEIQIRTAIETTNSPSNELIGYYIVANIRYVIFSIFTWLCFLAAFVCWICGWLEKEEI